MFLGLLLIVVCIIIGAILSMIDAIQDGKDSQGSGRPWDQY